MSGFLKGTNGVVTLHPGHQEIVGVERGEGKDADALVPERVNQGCEDAHGRQVMWTDDLETEPPCGTLNGRRDPLLRADDRQFIFCPGDAHKAGGMPGPFRDSVAWTKPHDCHPTR